MKQVISVIFSLTLMFVVGCSSSSTSPTQPDTPDIPDVASSLSDANLLYSGTFDIDIDNLTITQSDSRQSEVVYNITGFLPDKCPGGCFRFTIVNVIGTVLEIELTIENPLAIQVYDVTIEYIELFGKSVLNPDSYTDFLGTPITEFYPFTAFMKETSERAFPVGPVGIDTETLFLDFPPGTPSSVHYAITASLPGQIGAPYEISEMAQDGELTSSGGSAEISCKVDDHQDNISAVFLDSTPFTGGPVQMQPDPLNPGYYKVEISNTAGAQLGSYMQKIMALSPNPQNISTYNYVEITVAGGVEDPVADLTRGATGCAPVDVTLDASGSTDADDPLEDLEFEFDFDYDGITFDIDRARSSDPVAIATYMVEGCYTAAVRVYDTDENTDIATITVPIGGFVPGAPETDITDGTTITNIDFVHGAPTFVGDILWPGMSDPSKGSARGSGNIYTVFYGVEGGSGKIFFSRSNDDAETWSSPVAVHTYDSTGLYSGCSIAADNTGQVIIVWADHFHRDLGMEYSFDSGDSFASKLIRDQDDCMYWCDKYRMPDVAIDPTNPDNIIVSCNYNHYGDPTGWFTGWDQMYVDYSSTGPAGTFNEVLHILPTDWRPGWVSNIYRIHAHYAIDGDAYIIAGENNNIHVFRSQDSGATWAPHVRYEIDTWHRDFDTTMDPTDSEVFYVAAVRRNSYNMELYKSTDGLNLTQIQSAVNDNTTVGYRLCPSVTVNDAGVVYMMWHTNEAGTYDIMSDYSCDGGATFGTDVVFNTDDIGNEVDADLIPNACGDGVVCIWEQNGNNPNGKLVARRG